MFLFTCLTTRPWAIDPDLTPKKHHLLKVYSGPWDYSYHRLPPSRKQLKIIMMTTSQNVEQWRCCLVSCSGFQTPSRASRVKPHVKPKPRRSRTAVRLTSRALERSPAYSQDFCRLRGGVLSYFFKTELMAYIFFNKTQPNRLKIWTRLHNEYVSGLKRLLSTEKCSGFWHDIKVMSVILHNWVMQLRWKRDLKKENVLHN